LYELEYYANDGLVQCLRQRLGAPLAPQQARELLHAAKATRYVDVRQFWDGEEMVAVEVAESPMLRELSELAEELLGPWAPEHVGWWILSGEAPIIAPIRALVHLQDRFRVASYSKVHENSNLCTFVLRRGA
jgi:hypothetical protein